MRIFSTIQEIKDAVDSGAPVYCDTDSYQVIKDNIGQYLIHYLYSDYCIGLHGRPGTKYEHQLNGRNFYSYS